MNKTKYHTVLLGRQLPHKKANSMSQNSFWNICDGNLQMHSSSSLSPQVQLHAITSFLLFWIRNPANFRASVDFAKAVLLYLLFQYPNVDRGSQPLRAGLFPVVVKQLETFLFFILGDDAKKHVIKNLEEVQRELLGQQIGLFFCDHIK